MSEATEKRLSTLINVAYVLMILAAFYLVFKTFSGILMPFILAFVFATLLHRPITYLNRKIKIPRSPLSAVFVLLILALLATIIMFAGMEIVDQVKGFIDYLKDTFGDMSEIADTVKNYALNVVSMLPNALAKTASESITSFFDRLSSSNYSELPIDTTGIDWSSILSKGGSLIKNTLGQVPSALISVLITIIATVFMCADYEKIRDFILRQAKPKTQTKLLNAKTIVLSTFKKMFKAYLLIILITATELSIGMYILKAFGIFDSAYIIMIAIIIAIIDIIPVLGTGTVLIPWAIYSFISGNISMGIGLLVIYALITVIRQIIEPKLVAGQVGLSPIVTIIAMYIGTKTLGILGFFILPFTVIAIKQLNDEGVIHIFKKAECENENTAESESQNETSTINN
jgi:sporulation integral membrane protein YtvI